MSLVLLVLAAVSTFLLVSCIKPVEVLVEEFGYKVETHNVVTPDHYLLTIHRLLQENHLEVVAGNIRRRANGRPSSEFRFVRDIDFGVPVLIVIGILQSSASFLAKGDGIAYSLVDQGFDVWVTNYRGNMYSRRHEYLSPTDRPFWEYTLHELATEDLPAIIDHVLDTTRRQQLIYVGFSMGTTLFWILASSLPDYQAKVAAMVAIGPVARPCNMIVMKNAGARSLMKGIFKMMWHANACEALPYNKKTSSVTSWLCTQKIKIVCEKALNKFNKMYAQHLEIETAFKLIPYFPAGISTRVFLHYIQIIETRRFEQFDYGRRRNREVYGSSQPPDYDLDNIQVPVYLVYSDKDEIATPQDVEWLAQQLPRRPERRIDSVNDFRHMDFNLHENLRELFTVPMTSLIAELARKYSVSLARQTNFGANLESLEELITDEVSMN